MTLEEYAEKVSQSKLSEWQKNSLQIIEEHIKSGSEISVPPRSGKQFDLSMCMLINDWRKNQELKEYRCSCGRLLGRFNGQAEVKCPKCRKMNVIGVENK